MFLLQIVASQWSNGRERLLIEPRRLAALIYAIRASLIAFVRNTGPNTCTVQIIGVEARLLFTKKLGRTAGKRNMWTKMIF